MLLVDDDATEAALFKRAVVKTGLDIRLQILDAGQEAIHYLMAKGKYADRSMHPLPDVIVLDLRMPHLNGFDFLAWREASALFLSIPVVVCSGSTAPDEISRVFELGANKHLQKPKNYDDWEKIVRAIWEFTTEGTKFLRRQAEKRASGS